MNTSLIGSVINALPLDRMISGPLMAMMKAQVTASKMYADFLLSVCIENGKAIAVEFDYDETLVDTEGQVAGVAKKKMTIPLMAVITHPNICIENGTIDFELEVSQSEEIHEESAQEGELKGSFGWGPFKVSVSGKVSHHKEQTRKTDTRAKYSIHVDAKRQPPPEALMRVIDFLTDAATKPVQIEKKEGKGEKNSNPVYSLSDKPNNPSQPK
ncbi:MAG: DUF2589 domain-containing protein [Spirochaetales bacterium]|nr:DUF2589 domain-containing protein [Spirochaetales bacterium]